MLAVAALLSLQSALAAGPSPAAAPRPPAAALSLPPGQAGTFVLLDATTGAVERLDPARAAVRVSPCSTFKIMGALAGLEAGVLSGPEHRMAWDGVRRDVEAWNQDQTLRTAISRSVVWYFQRVAEGVGLGRLQAAVDGAAYGNRDLSGGVTRFWLGSSLLVSADEQVTFLRRLVAGTLPFAPAHQATVRELLTLRRTARGTLHGKTGTAGEEPGPAIGWFVGWVEAPGGAVNVFALRLEGRAASGRAARALAERALEARGLL